MQMAGAPGIPMMALMSGMEHAEDTLGVPPLIQPRVLAQFCSAVQLYADGVGLHEKIEQRLQERRMRLENLRSVATLFRLAVLGHPESFERLRDELHCIADDFPSDPLETQADAPNEREAVCAPAHLSAVLDLLAAASFVSKDDPARRDALTIGVIRAVEDAICYPLAYSQDAATYLREGSGQVSRTHAESVIANATSRLLKDDYGCDPRVPAVPLRLLEGLGQRWMAADPVSELFRALTGPQLTGLLHAIKPKQAQVGATVSLKLDMGCVGEGDEQQSELERLAEELVVVFCPRQPAKFAVRNRRTLRVEVPPNAHSGPIALVRRGSQDSFKDLEYLLEQYACEYPLAWSYSAFSFIPITRWTYPEAFGPPRIEIAQVPTSALVSAFTSSGLLGEQNAAHVGEPVAIQYQITPAGSDANVPLSITATNGTITHPGQPGMILYTPQATGESSVELTWGTLTESVAIPVEAGSGGQ